MEEFEGLVTLTSVRVISHTVYAALIDL